MTLPLFVKRDDRPVALDAGMGNGACRQLGIVLVDVEVGVGCLISRGVPCYRHLTKASLCKISSSVELAKCRFGQNTQAFLGLCICVFG